MTALTRLRISTLKHGEFEKLLQDLVAIYDSAYQEEPQRRYRTRHPTQEYLRWLYEGDPAGFFVAWIDSKPVGFASVHGSWTREGRIIAEVHEIAVRKEYQGRGIGRRLLQCALEYAKVLGRERVGLWVGEENRRAARLYEQLGFRRTGTWNEWVRMEMQLTPGRR